MLFRSVASSSACSSIYVRSNIRKLGFQIDIRGMLESGDRRPTRDQIVRLAAALDLSGADADDLLTAGGHLPAAYDAVPPIDPDVLLLVRTLADPALSAAERLRLRLIVRLACATWRPEAFDLALYALD